MGDDLDELRLLISQARDYIANFRAINNSEKLDYFFISMLEICASLAELGIERNRAITIEEEENWFLGSYHLDFWDSDMNNSIYIPLVKKVKQQSFFRK